MSKKLSFISAQVGFLLMASYAFAQTGEPLISPGPGFVGAGTEVPKVTSTIVDLLFYVAAFLAVVYLIIGGVRWITSRGDKTGIEAARKQIVAAIVGLVVVAGAFLILKVVFGILGVASPFEAGPGGFKLPSLKP